MPSSPTTPSAASLLPGVPLVESPFFDEIFVEGAFDAETLRIARDFRRDGYAVIDFPDDDFNARVGRIREKLQPRYEWDAWRRHEKESLRVQDGWKSDEDIKAIAVNPRILSLISALYGRPALPFQTLNFPVGTQQHVHSDSTHFNCYPERFMCGVWVALEDIGPEQGPLVYLPGTHRWPVYTNEHLGVNSSFLAKHYDQYRQFEALWDRLIATHGIAPKQFHARKGQALIWAANLLHGGASQTNLSLTRWSQVTHYFFEGGTYYTPLASDPFYGRIAFRDICDLRTGETVRHRVGGEIVPDEFIRAVMPRRAITDAKVIVPDDFDAAGYFKRNPDVAAAGVDARKHYIEFGAHEGRRWR